MKRTLLFFIISLSFVFYDVFTYQMSLLGEAATIPYELENSLDKIAFDIHEEFKTMRSGNTDKTETVATNPSALQPQEEILIISNDELANKVLERIRTYQLESQIKITRYKRRKADDWLSLIPYVKKEEAMKYIYGDFGNMKKDSEIANAAKNMINIGDYDIAVLLYNELYFKNMRELGGAHPTTLLYLSNLGRVLMLSEFDLASQTLLHDALNAQDPILKNESYLPITAEYLGDLFFKMNKWNESEEYFKMAYNAALQSTLKGYGETGKNTLSIKEKQDKARQLSETY